MPLAVQDPWNGSEYAQHSEVQYAWATELLQQLQLRGDERVLDVGCGPGALTAQLARRVADGFVLGLDKSASMIDFAEETYLLPNLEFQRRCIENFSAEGQLDLVVSFSCLHWIEDQATALKNIAHSLRPGGRYLFSLGAKSFPLDEPYDSALATGCWTALSKRAIGFTAEEYRQLLTAVGLTVERAEIVSSVSRYESRAALIDWLRQVSFNKEEGFLEAVCDSLYKIYPKGEIPMPRLVVEGRK